MPLPSAKLSEALCFLVVCPPVCPSVRPKPKIPSFHLHMGPLVHPTNHDGLQHVRPSVRLSISQERFPGISWRLHGGNGLKFCMAPSEFIRLWSMVIICWFSSFWCHFDLVKLEHFLKNAWKEWPQIVHADVSWPPSEPISLWSWCVDFSNFGTILT